MKIRALPWLAAASFLLSAPAALAQEEGGGDEIELEEDPLPGTGGTPEGAAENPDAPKTSVEAEAEAEKEAEAEADRVVGPYPIEEVLRPITLPKFMSEASLDYSAGQIAFGDETSFFTTGLLTGAFGITSEAQIGLRYGVGSFGDDAMGESGYIAGKALSLDFLYNLRDYTGGEWVAAQLSVPIYLDPFAIGVTVGAPFKFTFFDKLSLVFGRDLVSFKLHNFVPDVGNAVINDNLEQLDRTGADAAIPDSDLNLRLQVFWQHSENLAIDGRFGPRAPDFALDKDPPWLLDGGVTYSTSNMMDLGGRVGFQRLDEGFDSFLATVVAAFRI